MASRPMIKKEPKERLLRLAVLIDADNAQAAFIKDILIQIEKFGVATVKRIYGDFTSSKNASWKKVLQKYAIKPVQQFAHTSGKNATDSALIIDAMDLLYTQRFDGYCLITSDSDFTGLAMRLREEGLTVLGFGEKKTPTAFCNACHKFVFTESFRVNRRSVTAKSTAKASDKQESLPKQVPTKTVEKTPKFPKKFVLTALDQSVDDAGWAGLGVFGSYLNKLQPDFDSRLYGYKKLSDLVKAKKDLFEIEERLNSGSNQKILYLRAKT